MPKTSNPLTKTSGVSLNVVLTAIVLVVAVAVVGSVLWFSSGSSKAGGGRVPASVLSPPGSDTVSDGGKNAPTLVEFVDYQCPVCHRFYKTVTRKIENEYANQINFVVRNFPLDMHQLAKTAAKAVEAASMQGKFNEMYHKVFDNYRTWAKKNGQISSDKQRALEQFDTFAKQLGLDLQQFHKDMKSDEVAQRIQQDKADGKKAGVRGTPTFFLNGKKLEFTTGNPLQELRNTLDKALAK